MKDWIVVLLIILIFNILLYYVGKSTSKKEDRHIGTLVIYLSDEEAPILMTELSSDVPEWMNRKEVSFKVETRNLDTLKKQ